MGKKRKVREAPDRSDADSQAKMALAETILRQDRAVLQALAQSDSVDRQMTVAGK